MNDKFNPGDRVVYLNQTIDHTDRWYDRLNKMATVKAPSTDETTLVQFDDEDFPRNAYTHNLRLA